MRIAAINWDTAWPKPMAIVVGAAVAALSGVSLSVHAGPLPTNGQFISGSGSISAGPGALTINQTSGRAVIDWRRFSIGYGQRVAFNNGTGATLNRVAVQTTGAGGAAGDINVAASFGWTGAGALSLNAYRNVHIEQGVTVGNEGAGGLTLRAAAKRIDERTNDERGELCRLGFRCGRDLGDVA